jgi:hypothetical protein
MIKDMLTFEITGTGDTIEIHADLKGLSRLIEILKKLPEEVGHTHLMTSTLGGTELTKEKQGVNNKLANHVKIVLWK